MKRIFLPEIFISASKSPSLVLPEFSSFFPRAWDIPQLFTFPSGALDFALIFGFKVVFVSTAAPIDKLEASFHCWVVVPTSECSSARSSLCGKLTFLFPFFGCKFWNTNKGLFRFVFVLLCFALLCFASHSYKWNNTLLNTESALLVECAIAIADTENWHKETVSICFTLLILSSVVLLFITRSMNTLD